MTWDDSRGGTRCEYDRVTGNGSDCARDVPVVRGRAGEGGGESGKGIGSRPALSRLTARYSERRVWAGLMTAAFRDWKMVVSNARMTTMDAATMKGLGPM